MILLSLFSFSLLALKKGEAASKNPLQQLWQRKSLDPYAGERLQIWNDCWNYFLDQPLQGTGLGTFRDHYPQYKTIPGLRLAPYAHNEWLNILCETGTIGALILLGLGALLLKTIRNQKERWHEWGIWMGVVAGAFSQGTLDFSLRYAPVLLFVLIALATILPVRTTEIHSQKIKTGLWISFSLLGILFALPGIADCIFKIHAPHPDERKEGALIASVLDPFNALYRSQTGRMRDLVIAMDLEPRNVWYHREAVLWYLQEWKRSKNVTFLKTALEEYKKILRMAPNVAEFQKEYRELFSTMTSQ
ncbi:MAG: O-antigen ligase family protein [Elusimicrobia bacterium]|nr:O-antigen ligase family protein [Elusimicrobiota bacterium]